MNVYTYFGYVGVNVEEAKNSENVKIKEFEVVIA